MKLKLLLCGTLLALPGCLSMSASASFGPRISSEVLVGIVPGETSKAEVVAKLGPPEEYLRQEVAAGLSDDEARISGAIQLGNRAHDVLTWQHDWFHARGRWWLLYLWIDSEVDSDVLMIVFDEQERVRDISFRETVR